MFDYEVTKQIREVAERYGWNPSSLLAVVEVESAGISTWTVQGKQLPPIRFEGHYFYKLLDPDARAIAVSKGLAHPKGGYVKNPRTYEARYALFARAFAVDKNAAMESISMGVGQVMGVHWATLGYDSVNAMFGVARSGVGGQVEIMARYIVHFGLGRWLTGEPTLKKFSKFARGYNGRGYKKNKYHTRMLAAAKRWMYSTGGVSGVERSAKEELLADIQKDLSILGYNSATNIDGKSGKKTKVAVRKFQNDNGLVADGIPGTMTREAIDAALKEKESKSADATIGGGVAVTAPAVAIDTIGQVVLDKVSDVQSLGITSSVIDVVVTGLTVAGVCMLVYGFYKKFRSGEHQ